MRVGRAKNLIRLQRCRHFQRSGVAAARYSPVSARDGGLAQVLRLRRTAAAVAVTVSRQPQTIATAAAAAAQLHRDSRD